MLQSGEELWLVVSYRLIRVFLKVLIYWDFHTQLCPGSEKMKCPESSSSCVEENIFLMSDENVQTVLG